MFFRRMRTDFVLRSTDSRVHERFPESFVV